MNIIISGKDFSLTPSLKEYVEGHMAKIERLFPFVTEAKVELDVDKNQKKGMIYRAEVSVHVHKSPMKAGEKAEHMQEAINLCIPKLVRQLERYKETKRSREPSQG